MIGVFCDLPKGHDGAHRDGEMVSCWPRIAGMTCPGSDVVTDWLESLREADHART